MKSIIFAILLLAAATSLCCNNSETYEALELFYNSTGGEWWIDNKLWNNRSVSYCDWSGVYCDTENNPCEVLTISMWYNNVSGTIPPQTVKNLPNVINYVLPGNHIEWGLNTILRYANTSLEFLNLLDNKFTETLDNSLFDRFSGIRVLDLSHNYIYGEITFEMLNTQMNYTYLNNNRFSGTLPPLRNLLRSVALNVANNQLSGTIPPEYFNNSLWQLNLADNNFGGELPSFKGLSKVNELVVAGNNLEGELKCSFLTKFPHLRSLSLGRNNFYGEVPQCLFYYHMQDLVNLDLSWNNFSGEIDTYFVMTEIAYFNIRGNNFSGEFPYEPSIGMVLADLRDNPLLRPDPENWTMMFPDSSTLIYDPNSGKDCAILRVPFPWFAEIMVDPHFYDYKFCY